ncbi:MAG: T9SS type A sorting domain-containing protein [Bacteroidales bacterium]
MKKVIIMLFIASLWGSLFAQQGLGYENDSKELTTGQNKYTEIEMNLVDQFHFKYWSRIIGLSFDGEYIWCSDLVSDSLLAIDKNTGEIIKGFPFPVNSSLVGLAHDGEYLWASGGQEIYKIDPDNGTVISSFIAPIPWATNASITGLVWVNNILYCTYTGGFSSRIYGIDVYNVICVDTIDSGGISSPFGLTYMEGFFWIHDYAFTKILKVNPDNGQNEGWFPHHYYSFYSDITYDGEYIYCSDGFCNIFKYEFTDTTTSIRKELNITFNESNFKVYPNPVQDRLIVEFYLLEISGATTEIYSINGNLVRKVISKKHFTTGWNRIDIAVTDLLSGEYILKLFLKNKIYNKKFIIKN